MRQNNIQYIVTKIQEVFPEVDTDKIKHLLSGHSTEDIAAVADAIARFGVETLKQALPYVINKKG